MKLDLRPFLLGITTYFILYFLHELYGVFLVTSGIIKVDSTGVESWNWHPLIFVSTFLSALLVVMPGFLTGWFSSQKATLNGAILVAFCQTITFFFFTINWESGFDPFIFVGWFQQLIIPVSVGAMSGAAGQFHKTRKQSITS